MPYSGLTWFVGLLAACLVAGAIYSWYMRSKKHLLALSPNDTTAQLKQIKIICNAQYQCLSSYLKTFQKVKNNRINSLRDKLELPYLLLQPQQCLRGAGLSTYINSVSPKIVRSVISVRDELYVAHYNLVTLLKTYPDVTEAYEQEYSENIIGLSKMHDELSGMMHGKTFDKTNGADWYTGYFSIFGAWFQKGANNDIEVTHTEIVQHIISLNKLYRFVPFVIHTTENALRCDFAFKNIADANQNFRSRIEALALAHRKAVKIASLLMQYPVPQPSKSIFKAWKPRLKPERETMLRPKDSNSTVKSLKPAGWAAKPNRRWVYWLSGFLILSAALFIIAFFDFETPIPNTPAMPATKHSVLKTAAQMIKAEILSDTADFKMLFKKDTQAVAHVYGIDVSRYQGNLIEDFDRMDTIHFAICKATEGRSYTDPDFQKNWEFCSKRNLVRGAYHFYHADEDPVVQAGHFINTVKAWRKTDIPPVVDVEEDGVKGVSNLKVFDRNLLVFLDYIQKKTNRTPVIYSDLSFANTYYVNDTLARYPLWLAEYSSKKSPKIPKLWRKNGYVIWQKKDNYSIDSEKADFDVFNGDGKDLIKFIKRSNR